MRIILVIAACLLAAAAVLIDINFLKVEGDQNLAGWIGGSLLCFYLSTIVRD